MRGMDAKRLNVAVEGQYFDKTSSGTDRWLQMGALMEHPGRWTIVTWKGDTSKGLGTAAKIKRDISNGDVSMLVRVQKKWGVDLDDVECGVNFVPQMVTASKDGKTVYVIAAYITEVTLELKGPKHVAIAESLNPETPIPL